MDAAAFWRIIGEYNTATITYQIALFVILLIVATLAIKKNKGWLCKAFLGILNLFIGVVFFAKYGTEPIQLYFALPLYIGTGVLFLYDAWKNKDAECLRPNTWQWVLIGLYLLYPVVSILCGSSYPEMVTHIMPCPVITISIALYSCFAKKNRLLLILMTIWGLTGVKAIIFHAYEDLILLAAGIYGVILVIKSFRKKA